MLWLSSYLVTLSSYSLLSQYAVDESEMLLHDTTPSQKEEM